MSFVPSLPSPTRAILFLPYVSGKGTRLNDSPALRLTGSPESASSSEMSQAMSQSLLLIVDSDKAFATAQENGGAGILKKNPQQPVLYFVFGRLGRWERATRMGGMYGTSHSDSKGVSIIDATSASSCAPLRKILGRRALSVASAYALIHGNRREDNSFAWAVYAHSRDAFISAIEGTASAGFTRPVRSPRRISTIAPRIATDDSTTRMVNGSCATSHPSRTATIGFA
jgi:hypothetical protein